MARGTIGSLPRRGPPQVRHLLVDHARAMLASKRVRQAHVRLEEDAVTAARPVMDALVLDEALSTSPAATSGNTASPSCAYSADARRGDRRVLGVSERTVKGTGGWLGGSRRSPGRLEAIGERIGRRPDLLVSFPTSIPEKVPEEYEGDSRPSGLPSLLRTGSMLPAGTSRMRRDGSAPIGSRAPGEGGIRSAHLPNRRSAARRVATGLAEVAFLTIAPSPASKRSARDTDDEPSKYRSSVRRGSSPNGRPYFVMEYVAGESITEFCDVTDSTRAAPELLSRVRWSPARALERGHPSICRRTFS